MDISYLLFNGLFSLAPFWRENMSEQARDHLAATWVAPFVRFVGHFVEVGGGMGGVLERVRQAGYIKEEY